MVFFSDNWANAAAFCLFHKIYTVIKNHFPSLRLLQLFCHLNVSDYEKILERLHEYAKSSFKMIILFIKEKKCYSYQHCENVNIFLIKL